MTTAHEPMMSVSLGDFLCMRKCAGMVKCPCVLKQKERKKELKSEDALTTSSSKRNHPEPKSEVQVGDETKRTPTDAPFNQFRDLRPLCVHDAADVDDDYGLFRRMSCMKGAAEGVFCCDIDYSILGDCRTGDTRTGGEKDEWKGKRDVKPRCDGERWQLQNSPRPHNGPPLTTVLCACKVYLDDAHFAAVMCMRTSDSRSRGELADCNTTPSCRDSKERKELKGGLQRAVFQVKIADNWRAETHLTHDVFEPTIICLTRQIRLSNSVAIAAIAQGEESEGRIFSALASKLACTLSLEQSESVCAGKAAG